MVKAAGLEYSRRLSKRSSTKPTQALSPLVPSRVVRPTRPDGRVDNNRDEAFRLSPTSISLKLLNPTRVRSPVKV
jgi:hypothetical protein